MKREQETVDDNAALGRLVEDLAMQFVLGGGADTAMGSGEGTHDRPEWLGPVAAKLQQIRDEALRDGRESLARVAEELFQRADTPEGGGPTLYRELESGLARLQAAVAEQQEPRVAPAAGGSLAQDQELVNDFLVEARDHLSSIESRVLVLEQNPGDLDAIHAIFRGFHTIKGLAGFLEFAAMQEVAHETETLLSVSQTLSSTLDMEMLPRQFLRHVVQALGADTAGIWLLSEDGEWMVADAGVGDPMAGATLLVGDDGGAEACAQISGG